MQINDAATIIADEYYRLRTAWFGAANVLLPALLKFAYLPISGKVSRPQRQPASSNATMPA